jgi:hypothetical protein
VLLKHERNPRKGYFPDLLYRMTATPSSAAAAALLYKVMRAWIDLENGRRFVVTLPTGTHVEATQLSQRAFKALLADIEKLNDSILLKSFFKREQPLIEALKARGFTILGPTGMEFSKMKLESTAYKTIEAIRDKHALQSDPKLSRGRKKSSQKKQVRKKR